MAHQFPYLITLASIEASYRETDSKYLPNCLGQLV